MIFEDVLNKSLTTIAHDLPVEHPIETSSDADLVSSVLSGDEQAFGELFERYKRPVARCVGRFFRDRHEIEEFVQQAFTKAYFSLVKFQGSEDRSFGAWITRIAVNACYDEFRRRKRMGHTIEVGDEENSYLENIIDGRVSNTESDLMRAQLAEKVLSSLSPEDRIALTMVYSEEYTIDEAAGAIGITSSSLKSRLFRCRGQLKAKFGYLFR